MKKFFTSFLIIIFLFNTAGTELIFSIQLEQCRLEAEKLISGSKEEEIEVLLVIDQGNQKKLHRSASNEIEYEGMLYDIKKEERRGSTILIYAFMDTKEENLKNKFTSENAGSNNPVKNEKAKISNKNLLPFCLSYIPYKNNPLNYSLLKNYFTQTKYLQPEIESATPPPQA